MKRTSSATSTRAMSLVVSHSRQLWLMPRYLTR